MKRTEAQLIADITKPSVKRRLLRKCDRLYSALSVDYPKYEVDTWAFQLDEAKGLINNPNANAPFITSALRDGETKAEYAQLIVDNNNAWSVYAGGIVKIRRETEAAIAAATTPEELEAIQNQIGEL